MSMFCAIPFAAWLFSACGPAAPLAVGYVEGEYVHLAPIEVAQVETVSVRRGDRVEAGQPVVTLEAADARIAVAQAKSAVAQAQAQLADLKIGKRPEEIAVLEAAGRVLRGQGPGTGEDVVADGTVVLEPPGLGGGRARCRHGGAQQGGGRC